MIMRRINLSSWISNNKEENRVEVELPGKQGLKLLEIIPQGRVQVQVEVELPGKQGLKHKIKSIAIKLTNG